MVSLVPNTTTKGNTSNNSTTLPVLLIHGYMEDAAVWNKWIDLLKKDGHFCLSYNF